MADTSSSGIRESWARPRERDPDRHPRPDRSRDPERPRDRRGREERPRDRAGERPRDRAGERRRERNGGGGRRDGARGRGRDRDAPRDSGTIAHGLGDHRADEQRTWERSRPSRTRDAPGGQPRAAAPPPRPVSRDAPEPWPARTEGVGGRAPHSELSRGRYLPADSWHGEEVEFYQSEAEGLLECHQCRYLCTGRACCQVLELLLNLLVLVCSSVSYSSTGGYTGITSLGGIYYYQYGGAYSGFHGADGEKAQQLDVQFYQLKLPTVTAAMACSGAVMGFCCLLITLGVLRVPGHCPWWLLVEGLLDVVLAGAYVPALYFYFQQLSAAYASPVCKERAALYQGKGYSGFSCAFHGGDIGAGIFAALAALVFAVGTVLAVKGYRKLRALRGKPAGMLVF